MNISKTGAGLFGFLATLCVSASPAWAQFNDSCNGAMAEVTFHDDGTNTAYVGGQTEAGESYNFTITSGDFSGAGSISLSGGASGVGRDTLGVFGSGALSLRF